MDRTVKRVESFLVPDSAKLRFFLATGRGRVVEYENKYFIKDGDNWFTYFRTGTDYYTTWADSSLQVMVCAHLYWDSGSYVREPFFRERLVLQLWYYANHHVYTRPLAEGRDATILKNPSAYTRIVEDELNKHRHLCSPNETFTALLLRNIRKQIPS